MWIWVSQKIFKTSSPKKGLFYMVRWEEKSDRWGSAFGCQIYTRSFLEPVRFLERVCHFQGWKHIQRKEFGLSFTSHLVFAPLNVRRTSYREWGDKQVELSSWTWGQEVLLRWKPIPCTWKMSSASQYQTRFDILGPSWAWTLRPTEPAVWEQNLPWQLTCADF